MPSPTALITGISGQDGSYLAELLLAKGYAVFGTSRRGAQAARSENLRPIGDSLTIIAADPGTPRWAEQTLAQLRSRPDEIYHLAAETFVPRSWEQPLETADNIALGTLRLLEAVRREAPGVRVLVAGSSAMFGDPMETPQRESTPFRPLDPYSAAKAFAHTVTGQYREVHGLYAVGAMLFNHESPRRSPEFVTRKISLAVARIAQGDTTPLTIGSLDARRDWGFAGDYVDAMWRALQAAQPNDYVVGTGVTHSVREFCERAFAAAALDYRAHVIFDERFFRRSDDRVLVADWARAREVLGWAPRTSFDQLVKMMVEADVTRAAALPRATLTPNA
ncbi:MAG: GDP-mannose 4,6-dehydratase [Gemmatimonadaceae bacterium]